MYGLLTEVHGILTLAILGAAGKT